ncbi:unnamed protein product [Adineta steineri]|uniref:DUF229 domain containing protein n=1 Tax=Adineta steineri TaxID=433720 RepID=A0A814N732_9BILA|nr:unnamed protein product [Adineta steineri]CAF1088016.1 unnamed protein product [Adineta steineri]
MYFILISFSTVILSYNQPSSPVSFHSLFNSSTIDKEIIQCHFPQLLLNTGNLYMNIEKIPQPTCQSWFYPVIIDNYNIRLILSYLNCTVIFYYGQGDKRYQQIPIVLIYNSSIPLLSDHFTIQCQDIIKKKFYPILPYTSIHYNRDIRERLTNVEKENDEDFNVLILGFDSISRLQFQRMLPETFDYITKQLDAIILKGYNILGDGTPQQLIPMLTGFKEIELPSTLKRDKNSSFVDIYPFIWNKYRQNGYVTGYAEDRVEYGIWTFRLRGFNKTPTDHYLVPFYQMKSARSLLYKRDTLCIRNQTTLDFFLSYIDQFWSSYSEHKKFFFGFFKQYTHDSYAAASLLDLSLLKFLKKFNQTNDSKNTIIILMTDHGARFSKIRQTPQGKLEERLPFMSFIFPKLFQNKYPEAIKNLQKNIHRLTTPFDIHSTLLSLTDMNQLNYRLNNNVKQRNISLFHLIPSERTCDDLNLEPHWCSCLQWNNITIDDIKIKQATRFIINYINKQLSVVDNQLCHQLQLHSIHNAQIYRPNQALLRFSKSSDIDGRIPKYDDKHLNITFYQITFETKPNNAIYEATTQYSTRSSGFNMDLNHISRLNAYKSSASCIETSYSHLRKFCYCIK